MFRRSIILFVIVTLAALGITIGYAALGLAGPEIALEEAETALVANRPEEAVRLLDFAERSGSLKEQPELRARLLSIRHRAHQQTNNLRRSLQDLEELLTMPNSNRPDLRLTRIWLLASLGRGEAARLAAFDFLRENPGIGRGLELAGEACQVAYKQQLTDVSSQVSRDIGSEKERDAIRAMLTYLYRPEGDPGVQRGYEELGKLYAAQARLQQVWLGLGPQLQKLRAQIQEALVFFRDSLPAGGQPIAAWRALTFALEQAGRIDDVIALCEIYLLLFDHEFSIEGATLEASLHLRDGLYRPAVQVAERFLPDARVEEALRRNAIDARVGNLMTLKAEALWRLGDVDGLIRVGDAAEKVVKAGIPVNLAMHIAYGLAAQLRGDSAQVDAHMEAAGRLMAKLPKPTIGEDFFHVVMQLRADAQITLDAGQESIEKTFDNWLSAPGRTEDLQPRVAKATWQISQGLASAALSTAMEATQLFPRNEEVLTLLARAADMSYRPSGQDGVSLLNQCLRRNIDLPDVPTPVALVNCAEAALANRVFHVARSCARRAIDKFPWSRWPRLLEGKAALLSGDITGAVALLEKAKVLHPEDGEIAALLLEARQVSGGEVSDLLALALRKATSTPGMWQSLLRSAIEDEDKVSIPALLRSQANTEPSAVVHALMARGHSLVGEHDAAEANLAKGRAMAGEDRLVLAELATAAAEMLRARAVVSPDTDLETFALQQQSLLLAGDKSSATAWLRTASDLAAAGKAKGAAAVLDSVLGLEDVEDLRDGKAFLLAGDLALRLGRLAAAERHHLAAVSFPDGVKGAETLARLLLARDQFERAGAAMRQADPVTDAALALRLGQTELGRKLATQAATRDASDLVSQLTVALCAQVAPTAVGSDLRRLTDPQRERALEVLSLLQDDQLAPEALPRILELRQVAPASPSIALMLARAQWARGELDAAASAHAAAFAAGDRSLALLGEVVHCSSKPEYTIPNPLRAELRALALRPDALVPGRLLAHAMRELAVEAAARGQAEVATQILADLWLKNGEAAGVRLADAQSLLTAGRPREALALLDTLRNNASGEDLLPVLQLYFYVANQLSAAGDSILAAAMRATARSIIAAQGPMGPAVHFLFEEHARARESDSERKLPDVRARALLSGHLARCANGLEGMAPMMRSLELLLARFGSGEALVEVEKLQRAKPHSLALWRWRADRLAEEGRGEDALFELRRLATYADTPQMVLARCILAGEQRLPADPDLVQLVSLPLEVAESPDGRYARGLLALRAGNYGESYELLVNAPARPDGAHLYFAGMAALSSRDAESRQRAGSLFQQLAETYPSSSVARYAGSFASQLLPR